MVRKLIHLFVFILSLLLINLNYCPIFGPDGCRIQIENYRQLFSNLKISVESENEHDAITTVDELFKLIHSIKLIKEEIQISTPVRHFLFNKKFLDNNLLSNENQLIGFNISKKAFDNFIEDQIKMLNSIQKIFIKPDWKDELQEYRNIFDKLMQAFEDDNRILINENLTKCHEQIDLLKNSKYSVQISLPFRKLLFNENFFVKELIDQQAQLGDLNFSMNIFDKTIDHEVQKLILIKKIFERNGWRDQITNLRNNFLELEDAILKNSEELANFIRIGSLKILDSLKVASEYVKTSDIVAKFFVDIKFYEPLILIKENVDDKMASKIQIYNAILHYINNFIEELKLIEKIYEINGWNSQISTIKQNIRIAKDMAQNKEDRIKLFKIAHEKLNFLKNEAASFIGKSKLLRLFFSTQNFLNNTFINIPGMAKINFEILINEILSDIDFCIELAKKSK